MTALDSAPDFEEMSRGQLLDRLRRWNERLERMAAQPLWTLEDAATMTIEQLRQAVSNTLDRLLDIQTASRQYPRLRSR